jgi:hypothetical protein
MYFGPNEEISIWLGVEVFDTVAGAKERYEGAKERVNANEYSLADQAFWGEQEDAGFVAFRHSNAFAQCWGSRLSGVEWVPATLWAQDYAEELLEYWQSM